MTIEAAPLICFQGGLGCFQTAFSKMHKAADRLFTQTMRLREQLAGDGDYCRMMQTSTSALSGGKEE